MSALNKEAQVRLWIRHNVTAGLWKPGEKLPTLSEIARETNTSFGTVRKAVEELQRHGVLIGKQGKGIYLSSLAVGAYWNRFNHFRGLHGELIRFFPQCISFDEEKASAEVAQLLCIEEGTPVLHFWRTHCDQNTLKPLHLDEIFLVKKFFKNLSMELLNNPKYEHHSIYSVYERACGVVIGSTTNTMSARLYRKGDLPLDIFKENSAILLQQRISRLINGTPCELRRSFMNSSILTVNYVDD